MYYVINCMSPLLPAGVWLPYIRVFYDPLVSLNFEGFDPQVFLNDAQNLLFTFFISYEGGHCDPLKRMLRENPGHAQGLLLFMSRSTALTTDICTDDDYVGKQPMK